MVLKVENTDGITIIIILEEGEPQEIAGLEVGRVLRLENGGTIKLQDDGEYYYNKDNKNWFFDQGTMQDALDAIEE